jgi:hypothetical protein
MKVKEQYCWDNIQNHSDQLDQFDCEGYHSFESQIDQDEETKLWNQKKKRLKWILTIILWKILLQSSTILISVNFNGIFDNFTVVVTWKADLTLNDELTQYYCKYNTLWFSLALLFAFYFQQCISYRKKERTHAEIRSLLNLHLIFFN